MTSPVEKVRQAEAALVRARKELQAFRARRTFLCSCGKRHQFRSVLCVIPQVWEENTGDPNGGFWTDWGRELVCPETQIRQRIFFWLQATAQRFERTYDAVYRETIRLQPSAIVARFPEWVNNHDVDDHQDKFELEGV